MVYFKHKRPKRFQHHFSFSESKSIESHKDSRLCSDELEMSKYIYTLFKYYIFIAGYKFIFLVILIYSNSHYVSKIFKRDFRFLLCRNYSRSFFVCTKFYEFHPLRFVELPVIFVFDFLFIFNYEKERRIILGILGFLLEFKSDG